MVHCCVLILQAPVSMAPVKVTGHNFVFDFLAILNLSSLPSKM